MFELIENQPSNAVIKVIGVGGGGGNAVKHMIENNVEGVDFICANTDAQALSDIESKTVLQLGGEITKGLGAGANPDIGRAAAMEDRERIAEALHGADMVFITAGMGGGTGTGAAPIIAQAARELGVLTVGVVTKPFQFEGAKRMRQAEEGIEALQKMVDTLIIIPNQNLFRLANERTTFTEAFSMADDVLYQGVKGVTDLMVRPGLINLDFADVRAVMDEMGKAMMGTGEGEGEDRAVQAAEKAIANPLLDEISLKGAKGVLINITGGHDLTLFELDEAANRIREEVDADANIIVGSTLDTAMEGVMRVSVVATGIDANANTMDAPIQRRKLSEPLAQHPAAPVEEHPVAAQVVAHQQVEPSLFEDIAPAATQDDLPPPAYQPAPAAVAPEENAVFAHQPAADPQQGRPVPGTPSAEALARLERVTGRAPGSMAGHIPGEARAVPAATSAPAPTAPVDDRPRFGINNLINRMSGAQGGERQPQMTRQQPNMARPAAQPEVSEEQERIEIPAFLRRQAN